MGVYVDALRSHPVTAIQPGARRDGQKWCHMIADTDDELHAMAEKLGMRRTWFQGDHYDLVPSKRGLALRFGAQELDRRDFFMKLREYRVGAVLSKSSTSSHAKLVYVALMKRSVDEVVEITIGILSDATSLHRSSVKRALDELWTNGLIDVMERVGYGGANKYLMRGPTGWKRSTANVGSQGTEPKQLFEAPGR